MDIKTKMLRVETELRSLSMHDDAPIEDVRFAIKWVINSAKLKDKQLLHRRAGDLKNRLRSWLASKVKGV